MRSGLGEEADDAKDAEADGDTSDGAPEDLGVGARGISGTGTVGAESDPVGY